MALTLDAGLRPYDVMADRDAVVAELRASPVIDELTSRIDVYDMNSILTFGADAAEAIARASDGVLRGMSAPGQDDSGPLMEALAALMTKFDAEELGDGKRGLLGRLFKGKRDGGDLMQKYDALGDELDRVLVRLRACEASLRRTNRQLDDMFEANVGYLHELEKYIVAGEQGCREISDYIARREAALARTGDQAISFELQTLRQALTLLERRVQDLRTSEIVALQAIPMIRTMQFNNLSLAQKIDSAFILTLPAFRQALAQAVLLKRQRLQADALKALEARKGPLPRTGPQAPAASGDALEQAKRAIVEGIGEARALRDGALAQRDGDRARLEAIKREYAAQKNPPACEAGEGRGQ